MTAIPLILFGAAAIRVPLSTMGLLQYLAPVFQFGLGVLYFHEAMPPERWAGFALVWLALTVLTWDALRNAHRTRARAAQLTAEAREREQTQEPGQAQGPGQASTGPAATEPTATGPAA